MTNTIDVENINCYIEHHPDKGCDLYPECGSCPFRDCLLQTGRQPLMDEQKRLRDTLYRVTGMLRRKNLWGNFTGSI